MRNSGKKWMFQKKRSVLNSQYLTHRPPSSGLNGLENDCKEKFIYSNLTETGTLALIYALHFS